MLPARERHRKKARSKEDLRRNSTFLMVFLIQATQNRDTFALQLKLDELIFATKNGRNQIAGIEEAPAEEIENAKAELQERTE